PEDGAIHSFLGEAIVFSASGRVTENARAAFDKAIGVDGTDPAARFYLALASAQGGNLRGAFDAWLALAADTPLDAPWRPVLMQQLETAARDLDVDLAAVMPAGPNTSSTRVARGPSNEDVEAAQQMSPQDRAQMIRGMVEQLAARLNDNPNDPEGWERLGRSYRILGETAKAAEAEARAQALRNTSDAGQTARLNQGNDEAPVGASADGAQQEMIEGMVAGLAARLDDDPQDREGWLRLTRSYQVLGQTTLALESFEKAVTHFPQDAELLQLFARAVVAQSSPDAQLSNRAFNLYRRILEIQRDNAEALYFVGLGEAERENHEEARRLWSTLLESLAPGSDARNIVEERLRGLSTP
ncbi:MAG: tetratricopeptide repeat protein, partial [Alphaproteobacteria bacterium]|nr:tetratricopeptide repeat protein [Alphaproteobacteria bacterium]